jgi:ribonucleoside-diphosphate reductase beta chain
VSDGAKLDDRATAINWNRTGREGRGSLGSFDRQLWLPEKVPVSNDIPSWGTLNDNEKQLTMRVFTG